MQPGIGQGVSIWRPDLTSIEKKDVVKALSFRWAAELQANPRNRDTVEATLRQLGKTTFPVVYTSSVSLAEIMVFDKEASGLVPSDEQASARAQHAQEERASRKSVLRIGKERTSVAIIKDMLAMGMTVSDVIKEYRKSGQVLWYAQVKAIKDGKVRKDTISVRVERSALDVQAQRGGWERASEEVGAKGVQYAEGSVSAGNGLRRHSARVKAGRSKSRKSIQRK